MVPTDLNGLCGIFARAAGRAVTMSIPWSETGVNRSNGMIVADSQRQPRANSQEGSGIHLPPE